MFYAPWHCYLFLSRLGTLIWIRHLFRQMSFPLNDLLSGVWDLICCLLAGGSCLFCFNVSRLHGSSTSCFPLLQTSKKFSNVLAGERNPCISEFAKFKLMLFKGQLCLQFTVGNPCMQEGRHRLFMYYPYEVHYPYLPKSTVIGIS